MSRLFTAVVASCLAFLCGAAAAQQAGFPYPPSLPDATEHTYKTIEDVALRLWVFAPDRSADADPRPAAVFFFGGGWRTGSPAQFARQARALRDRGMVGVVADYRVSSRHGTRPWHAVADALDAVHWVRSHGAELGIDAERIAAGGGSAGGHLAAATATLAHPAGPDHAVGRPNALLLFNPAVVIADLDGSRRSEALAGLFERPLRTMSPYHHVTDGHPPTFVVHGKADTVVPADDAIAYCERVLSVGGVVSRVAPTRASRSIPDAAVRDFPRCLHTRGRGRSPRRRIRVAGLRGRPDLRNGGSSGWRRRSRSSARASSQASRSYSRRRWAIRRSA